MIVFDSDGQKNIRGKTEATPYADPCAGGFPAAQPGGQPQPADYRPWFWDEPPLPDGVADWSKLSTNTGKFALHFDDEPAWATPTETLEFHTWLVGVGANGEPVWFGPGWGWTSMATGLKKGLVGFTMQDLSPTLAQRYYDWIMIRGTDAGMWYHPPKSC